MSRAMSATDSLSPAVHPLVNDLSERSGVRMQVAAPERFPGLGPATSTSEVNDGHILALVGEGAPVGVPAPLRQFRQL